ncbi:hypothetical protein ACT6QH_06510 [Xanthobacter sp. TB0139]|uniref:hypothetical protein n=1 Tax=Xanthobacter sp. TB0139 TaxID=3459178 RepID=UPI004039FD8E
MTYVFLGGGGQAVRKVKKVLMKDQIDPRNCHLLAFVHDLIVWLECLTALKARMT